MRPLILPSLAAPGPRVLAVVLSVGVCMGSLTLPVAAGPRARLHSLRRRERSVRRSYGAADSEAAALSGRIDDLTLKRHTLETTVAELDGRLRREDARMRALRVRLHEVRRELVPLTARLGVVARKLRRRRALLAHRAVLAYEGGGPTSYVAALLTAHSFGELINRYQYYESAMHADSVVITGIERLRGELREQRAAVEAKKKEIDRAATTLKEQRAKITAVRGRKASALGHLKEVLGAKKRLLTRARQDKAHLGRVLATLERQSQHVAYILRAASRSEASGIPALGSSSSASVRGTRLLWPCSGALTSPFGWRVDPVLGGWHLHTGVDLGCALGAPVYAAETGVVVFVGQITGYGNVVMIDHGGGLATSYNHLSSFAVTVSQRVLRGQRIASVGATGYATGPHLHFEVRINGTPVDPLPYLQ